MQILFVDESGTPPPRAKANDSPYFVLGGLVVPEDYWSKLAADLRQLKKTFSVDGEIKWRNFAPPHKDGQRHSLSHLSQADRERLRTALYETIRKYKSIRIICVVVNVVEAYENLLYISSADDLYWYAYKQLTERFQYYLQDLSRTVGEKIHGVIVCDHRGPKDDTRLRELHDELLTRKKQTFSHYENLIEGLFVAPSHLSVGVQFADMVGGAVIRKFKSNDDRFFDQIKLSFRAAPNGKIDGYGLIKFPKNGW